MIIQKKPDKINLLLHLARNMGWRYVVFRVWYEIRRRTGLLKRSFPTDPPFQRFISLEDWRKTRAPFFFQDKESLRLSRRPSEDLKKAMQAMSDGEHVFFHSITYRLEADYDWLTNPETGYRYDVQKHWTEIADFSAEAGDIKYVWEKSRFSYLYDLIRYDYHFQEDKSKEVFGDIESWIQANPINQGPNYRCSQEIALRSLNWTFTLYYYANSKNLDEGLFQRMLHVLYWQLKHVWQNIHFSRRSVRNNHALTETLTLYLAGLLFPFFPESEKWKEEGKRWFEEEVAYQIYPDGTYLQWSHNYHRVVVQLLCWALYLNERHGACFSKTTFDRARKSLNFLLSCQNEETGFVPNYGGNDGALFFPWSDIAYRDYRPQLNALYYYFNRTHLYAEGPWREETEWFSSSLTDHTGRANFIPARSRLNVFREGGFYIIRDQESETHIRCGRHRDRPAQADNLHLDIWYGAANILRDAGSFRYNTDEKWIRYFNGTSAHNTVALNSFDQMQKGPRFIWLYWTQAIDGQLEETDTHYKFEGHIRAFGQLHPQIIHHRIVRKEKAAAVWEVEDRLNRTLGYPMRQYWNPGPAFEALGFTLEAKDENGNPLEAHMQDGYYSGKYGQKEKTRTLVFETNSHQITTLIRRT